MALTRRTFLGGSALAALTSACGGDRSLGRAAQGPIADRTLDDVVSRALASAKRGGASYADVRIVRRRTESVTTREDHVISVGAGETYGLGVRVIVDGAWASPPPRPSTALPPSAPPKAPSPSRVPRVLR